MTVKIAKLKKYTADALNKAKQIADLLNAHNKLVTFYTPSRIISSPHTYIMATVGNKVVGVVAIKKLSWVLSELSHLVVDPAYRRNSIGFTLVMYVIIKCNTPFVYATVREENNASLSLLTKCSFTKTTYYTTGTRRVNLLVARTAGWREDKEELYKIIAAQR